MIRHLSIHSILVKSSNHYIYPVQKRLHICLHLLYCYAGSLSRSPTGAAVQPLYAQPLCVQPGLCRTGKYAGGHRRVPAAMVGPERRPRHAAHQCAHAAVCHQQRRGAESGKRCHWSAPHHAGVLSYDYQIELGREQPAYRLGMSGGYMQYALDGAKLRAPEGIYEPGTGAFSSHNDPIFAGRQGAGRHTGV